MSLIGANVGNYRVVAKIGEGGMGSVFLGEHPLIGKRVAVKTLHPDLANKEDIVSRFFTEAKAVNDIGHPNIVDIVDFGKTTDPETNQEVVYFVMEFLDGEGLNSRLKREGVSPREAISVIRQCASALSASHKKGIVHRDLKPENIYLVQRGDDRNYVKLLDFGIAKLTGGEAGSSSHKTRTGLVMGTPAYMSPEQCEGRGNIDWRSDIYSLGVVFYEMLTGRVPFPGEGFGEILVAHLTQEPPLPSTVREDVPASLEAIVMHMMVKDKNRRFQSMDELVAALDDPATHLSQWGNPSGREDGSAAGTVMLENGPTRTGPYARLPTGEGSRPVTQQGPSPTTLSGASGEVSGGEGGRGRSRTPLFATLGVLVLAGAGGGVFFATRAPVPVQPAAVIAPPPAPPPAPKESTITVDSQPRGAQVFRAGIAGSIGVTPLKLTVKRSDPDFDVLLKLEGHDDTTRTISTVRDASLLIDLPAAKVEPPPPAAPEPEPAVAVKHRTPTRTTTKRAPAPTEKKKPADKDGVMVPAF